MGLCATIPSGAGREHLCSALVGNAPKLDFHHPLSHRGSVMSSSSSPLSVAPRSERRVVRAWALYDWANSAYVLTTVTAVLPVYFAGVVVPPGGVEVGGTTLAASTLWALMVGVASLFVFLAAPLLGAAADLAGRRRAYLAAFCLGGSLAALALAFSGPGEVWRAAALFVAAQIGFAGANVFYDAFLPLVARSGDEDRVSGLGFAYGYLGGGLHFVAALGLVEFHAVLGLSRDAAAQWAMGTAALWWGLFALPALTTLRDPAAPTNPGTIRLMRRAASAARGTLRILLRSRRAGVFLLAFLFYNDGIQTVIAMATIFGKEELGLSLSTLMLTLLMIQGVAFVGALAFTRLAGHWGTRRALLLALVVWTGVVCYAWTIDTAGEYMLLGALVGLVLGGSQSLSRSLYAQLIPAAESAQYFGYYSVVSKLSAVGGPFVFAAVRHVTGSSRDAVLAVLAFFIVGMTLLSRVREGKVGDSEA